MERQIDVTLAETEAGLPVAESPKNFFSGDYLGVGCCSGLAGSWVTKTTLI